MEDKESIIWGNVCKGKIIYTCTHLYFMSAHAHNRSLAHTHTCETAKCIIE